MFKARPVSRVRARREALARDILGIHPDFLMAVYGYGKMHAQPIARGWDPDGIGRRRGDGMRHASLDWHGRRLLWQRHGRERQRRVQDRTRLAAQTLPGPREPGAGDVPVGLVAELEAAAPAPGPQDTAGGENRVLCKPSGTSRLTIRAEQKSGHFNLYFFSPIIGVHIIR